MNKYAVFYAKITNTYQDQQIIEADNSLSAMRKFLEQFKNVVYTDEDFSKFTSDQELIDDVYRSLEAFISVFDVTNN